MKVVMRNLSKNYRVVVKKPGLVQAIKSLIHTEFRVIEALKNVNLEFNEGDIIGLVGNNGSGKTTLMKLLSGLLSPTTGEIFVNDYIPNERKPAFLKQVGFAMGQKGQLWWDLPAWDSYNLLMDIYECNNEETRSYIKKMICDLEIDNKVNQPLKTLSLGQRMKAELVGAMLHKPYLLLLDEPTVGLDNVSAKMIRKLVKEECNKRPMIALVSSHILDDIQDICNRILMLNRGEIKYNNSLESCYKQYIKCKNVIIKYKNKIEEKRLPLKNRLLEYTQYEAVWEISIDEVEAALKEIVNGWGIIEDITITEMKLDSILKMINENGDRNEKIY